MSNSLLKQLDRDHLIHPVSNFRDHGHTYSAHPVSAGIALEALRLYHEGGLLGALELVADKAGKRRFDPALRLNERISQIAYANGIVFRAFNDNILGFVPALCYSEDEMNTLFERLGRTLDTLFEEPAARRASA